MSTAARMQNQPLAGFVPAAWRAGGAATLESAGTVRYEQEGMQPATATRQLTRAMPVPDVAHLRRRPSLGTYLLPSLVLLAACAAAPRRPQGTSSAHTAGRGLKPAYNAGAKADHLTGGAAPRARPHAFEESDVGETAVLRPPAAVAAVAPAPTPAEVAALSHPTVEPVESTRQPTEPESLLTLIGPTTAPNVAAALRLVEDGRERLKQKEYDKALDCFERAVAVDPTNVYGYYFLAQLHCLERQYDQAAAFASRAAALSAQTNRIWLARIYSLEGAIFEEVGRYPDARVSYQKAVQADPDNLAARVGIARLSPE
jgi:hypothetical protein